jgi:cytochrome c oxidase subunit 3
MTFILIVSSVTMVLAVEAGHRMDKKGVIKWLAFTVIGGFIFLGSQAWEWTTFILGNGEHSTAYELADGNIAHIRFEDKHAHFEVGENPLKAAKEAINSGAKLQVKNDVYLEGQEALKALKGAKHVSGANLKRNEYGHRLYADFFFGITGFHGFHVFSGVIINIIVLINVIRGVYHQRGHYEMVEKAGLYWHFVDLVWVFVFTFFYLV